tara:strand:- start:5913 stop:7661 length:1749 start_codon:yes stop_codon:yes gene_type:complete
MADVDKGAYTNPFKDSENRVWDIVNDYDWTSAPAGSKLRSQTPNAYVTAYKMEFSQLQQFIDGYINIATSAKRAKETGTNPGMQFYKDMYKSGKVLADINFPFFSDDIRGFSSEYSDSFSPISQRGAKFLFGDAIEGLGGAAENLIGGAIAGGRELGNMGGNAMSEKVAAGAAWAGNMAGGAFEKMTGHKMPGFQTVGAPGSYIETPKFYQYSNTDEGVMVQFVLSNTLNDYRGNRGFKQNIKFIKEFTMMNRPYREGPIEMTFPAIYHIEIPGLRYIEWASLENFGIQLIGARRRIGKNIIPEAYGCTFAFRSLTIEAANFVQMTNRVEGFDENDAGYLKLRQASDKDAAKRAADAKAESDRRAAELAGVYKEDQEAKKRKEDEEAERRVAERWRERREGEEAVLADAEQLLADLGGPVEPELTAQQIGQLRSTNLGGTGDVVTEQDYRNLATGPQPAFNLQEGIQNAIDTGPPRSPEETDREARRLGASQDDINNMRDYLGVDRAADSERQAFIQQNADRTDLTDYERNNNRMVEESMREDENRELALRLQQERRDALASNREQGTPNWVELQPIEERED